MGKLFQIQSCSAGEGMTPPGDYHPCGEADTLPEAEALSTAEYAKGWRYTKIVANLDMVEAMRKELAQLRGDVEWLTTQPNGPVQTVQEFPMHTETQTGSKSDE